MNTQRETQASPHTMGPFILWRWMIHPVRSRLVAVGILGALLAPLVVAAWLQPDDRGVGTHQQLGMPGCALLVVTGVPCPTCGMTTAFSLAVRGRWWASFQTQPGGFLLAVSLMGGVLIAIASLVTGKVWSVNWFRIQPSWVTIAIVLLFACAWGYKIIAVRQLVD